MQCNGIQFYFVFKIEIRFVLADLHFIPFFWPLVIGHANRKSFCLKKKKIVNASSLIEITFCDSADVVKWLDVL